MNYNNPATEGIDGFAGRNVRGQGGLLPQTASGGTGAGGGAGGTYIPRDHQVRLSGDPAPLEVGKTRVMMHYDADSNGKPERIVITIDNPPSEAAADILQNDLPAAIQFFLEKNKDYTTREGAGFHTADLLGARGQFADMWRKWGKLHKGLWLGEKLETESPGEILTDFFGHIMLTLRYLRKGNQ